MSMTRSLPSIAAAAAMPCDCGTATYMLLPHLVLCAADPSEGGCHVHRRRRAVCQGTRGARQLPQCEACGQLRSRRCSQLPCVLARISRCAALRHAVAAQSACRAVPLSSPCCPSPAQVTALAFPNGRPSSAPDPKAALPTVKNSLGKTLEVVYDWGERRAHPSAIPAAHHGAIPLLGSPRVELS